MFTKKLLPLGALELIAVLLSDCSPKTGKSITSSKSDARSEITVGTSAKIADGKAIYTANCGKCHKLFEPTEKGIDTWNRVLLPMIKNARLTDEQGELVRAYVMANVK